MSLMSRVLQTWNNSCSVPPVMVTVRWPDGRIDSFIWSKSRLMSVLSDLRAGMKPGLSSVISVTQAEPAMQEDEPDVEAIRCHD